MMGNYVHNLKNFQFFVVSFKKTFGERASLFGIFWCSLREIPLEDEICSLYSNTCVRCSNQGVLILHNPSQLYIQSL